MRTSDAVDPDVPVRRPPDAPADGAAVPRSRVVEIASVVIAAMAVLAVAILALIMKFEADDARWGQRQTCLTWYRLQAEYGLGPWYEKLPEAAADCGGKPDADGTPLVPGGSNPALDPQTLPGSLGGGPPTPTEPTVMPPAPTATP